MKEKRQPKPGDEVLVLRCSSLPEFEGETALVVEVWPDGMTVQVGDRKASLGNYDYILR